MSAIDSEIIIQLCDLEDVPVGETFTVPLSLDRNQLEELLRSVLGVTGRDVSEESKFAFYLENFTEIRETLEKALVDSKLEVTGEQVVSVKFAQLASRSVRVVTRCSSSLRGHSEAVLCAEFSPDGLQLATGSGDSTVRIWDLSTATPIKTLEGHSNWVLCVAWSPDGRFLASAGMDAKVIVWEQSGVVRELKGHSGPITTLAWEPLHHLTPSHPPQVASGSQDSSIRIWQPQTATCLKLLSGHTKGVTQIIWSGARSKTLFSASRDTFIKVWDTLSGQPIATLKGHAHWINTLTSTYQRVVRRGAYAGWDEAGGKSGGGIEAAVRVFREFQARSGEEKLLSGSDDNSMFLWLPHTQTKPLHRLTGHQQLINHVEFSPDCRLLASASFDRSIKIWCALSGKYLKTLRGHCGRVYRISWSVCSNYVVSASSDSTIKVWDVNKGLLKKDLAGHSDEVYALDWSSNGNVASGGKDRIVKIWCH